MSQAKFLVGGEIVSAHIPEGDTFPTAHRLRIEHGSGEWYASAGQLFRHYKPISESARELHDVIIKNAWSNNNE